MEEVDKAYDVEVDDKEIKDERGVYKNGRRFDLLHLSMVAMFSMKS